jgi:malonyl-CoA O-methyltransferase
MAHSKGIACSSREEKDMPQYTRVMTADLSSDFDPHIDPIVAARWAGMPAARAPWLHEEVGRRMAERLDYIKLPMKDWTNWSWKRGGATAHAALKTPFWQKFKSKFKPPADLSQDMIWSNMQLHMEAAPKRMIEAWHAALKTDGFVLFSCLGPDALMELRAAYERRAWSAPLHTLTDMHDWGDRLVAQGFAEPVMDMERLVLTFASPERALVELRELGRNLNPNRGIGLQAMFSKGYTKAWRASLFEALNECRNADGQIALTFELIYGHAIKPKPRVKLSPQSAISLQTMREMLHKPSLI